MYDDTFSSQFISLDQAYAAVQGSEKRLSLIETMIADSIRKASGKQVERQTNLGEIGITSLEAVELMEGLHRQFSIKLGVRPLTGLSPIA